MPGPRCVRFLIQYMFSGNHLIVETIMEQDAKIRYSDVILMVTTYNYVTENELQIMLDRFYDEFAKDKSFITHYGLYIPTVIDDLMEQSTTIAVELYNSITTTLTKDRYTAFVLEYIGTSLWSKKIVYKVIEFELMGLKIMRTHFTRLQEEMGVNYGPLL